MAKRKRNKKKEKLPVVGLYQEAISFAIDRFRLGDSESHIVKVLKGTFDHLTEANVQLIIHRASQQIADEYAKDRASVVALHVKRYNQDIQKALSEDALAGEDALDDEEDEGMDPSKRRKIRIWQLNTCLDIMFAKERVLQLHTKDTQVKIYNKLNAKVKEKKTMFNLSDLTLEEKIEFLELVQKAKKNQVETFSIKMSDRKNDEEVTEDVEAISIETPNISKIKNIQPELKRETKHNKGIEDITEKIKKNLQRKALIQMKRKGAGNGPKLIDYTNDDL